jgi:hypothetical protein
VRSGSAPRSFSTPKEHLLHYTVEKSVTKEETIGWMFRSRRCPRRAWSSPQRTFSIHTTSSAPLPPPLVTTTTDDDLQATPCTTPLWTSKLSSNGAGDGRRARRDSTTRTQALHPSSLSKSTSSFSL